jgi:hypothetical protein
LRLCPLLVLSSALFASPAFAAPGRDRAEALYEEGKEAMARGDLSRACALLAESLRLDDAVGTLLNLATCEERSGKLSSALERFTKARGMLAKDDFRVAFAEERIKDVARRVARLTVRAPAAHDASLRISRDGVQLPPSSWNLPAVVDPGKHVVVIERPDAAPTRIDVDLGEGETHVVELPPEHAAAPARARASGPTPLAYVIGGVGIAGLATGAVFGIVAMNAANDYRDHCSNGECDPDGMSAAKTGRTASLVSPIALGVGALATGVGVYLFFATRESRVSVVPSASTSGGGLLLIRRF